MNEPGTRRSRFYRKRTGKRLELTTRDLEIFKLLQRYRYLRSTFIHAFVGGASETRFKERLGHLFHEGGYLARPPQQWQSFNARYAPAIYEIDTPAEAHLRTFGVGIGDANNLVTRGRMGANRQFAHALMICDTLASIELGTRSTPGLRFISWQEILAKAPVQTRTAGNPFGIPVSITYTFPRTGKTHQAKVNLVPDGLFGLEYTDGGKQAYRFFALEAEHTNRVYCGNLHQTSWLKKVLAYREIAAQKIYQSHLGLPNLIVMAVTPTEERIETMTKLIMDVTERKGSNLFLFKSIPVFGNGLKAPLPMPDLCTAPWARAGRKAFDISRV